MTRLLITFLTLLFSGLALADSSGSISGAPSTDLSIAYLGQIFGTVGNVLHGSSGDMLGQMFYKFNQGVFVVAGMWVAYTTTTMVLRSAAEGSFMGGNKSAGIFTILRIPLGLALLMPIPATGYESYQSLVMEVVIQGVNLADSTWSWALNYLQAGGALYIPPSVSQNNASTNYKPELALAQTVLASMTCMEISNAVSYVNPTDPSAANNPTAFTTYTMQTDNTGFNLLFPGLSNTPGQTVTPGTAACGYINWSYSNTCSTANAGTNTSNTNAAMQCSMAQAAAVQLTTDLADVAKQYACSTLGSTSGYCSSAVQLPADSPALIQMAGTAVLSAMVDYQNLMLPYANLQGQTEVNAFENFITGAESEGWIMAGRYYWDIAMLNDQYSSTAQGETPILSAGQVTNNAISNSNAIQKAINSIADKPTQDPCPNTETLADNVQCAFTTYYGTQNSASNYNGENYAAVVSGLNNSSPGLGAVLNVFVGPLLGILSLFSALNINPIIFVHNLGVDLLGLAGQIWLGTSIAVFGVYAVAYICESENPFGPAIQGAFDFLKPILLGIVAMLFGSGVMLAYYVPLYPYIIFTFATIGWFITVIEAMVAAPLVCLGLTHPEGHDFLGKAEQALMLLLSVFVRPVLLIIGLISGMVLSYVALLLLNTGFVGIITSLYASSSTSSAVHSAGDVNAVGGADVGLHESILQAAGTAAGVQASNTQVAGMGTIILAIIVAPTLMMIFTMLVYTIIQQSYSLIHVLPENIMTWIGGPQQQSHVGQLAQQMESAAKGFGGEMGGMAKGSGESFSGAVGPQLNKGNEKAAEKAKEKKQEDKADSRHSEMMGALKNSGASQSATPAQGQPGGGGAGAGAGGSGAGGGGAGAGGN